MTPRSRAIVLRTREPPSPALLTAELRLAQLVREVTALDDEVKALARALLAVEARYREATGAAFEELDRAEGFLRRLRRLADLLSRLEEALRRGPRPPARAARRAPPAGEARRVRAEAPSPVPEPPPAEAAGRPAGLELKALYRRLARRLHPDLARGDEAERARRSDLMARANASYARGDLAGLELLAERVGALEPPGHFTDAERRGQLARRIAAVEAARARLAAERDRLAASEAARLRDEAARSAAAGRDLFAEARTRTEESARALEGEVLVRLGELAEKARALARAREAARAELAVRGRGRRTFDPVGEDPLVRVGRRPARPAGAAGRALARWLEAEAQSESPWAGALTVLAFLGEEADRPLPALLEWPALAERWDALRALWPLAPELGPALCKAPRHLGVGLRLHREELWVALELTGPGLSDGVRAALGNEAVAALARRVMAALGPRERCERCAGEVYAVPLVRLSGLDEIHGLACPGCARVLRSFWRFGGRERRLEKVALGVGLVAEVRARFAGAPLAFQMLPSERGRLTARALVRRFRELCLEPNGLELPRGALLVRAGRTLLPAGARVPERARVEIVGSAGAGAEEARLAQAVRGRVKARFRPA